MNTQQIELIITVAETKSISKAAEKLFLSQSNASEMIKALEQEVGFSIFHRNNAGAVLTEKGERILRSAHIIRQQVQEIYKLKKAENVLQFHLGAANYSPVIWAFNAFYKENEKKECVDFSCRNFEWRAAIKELYNRKIDIFVEMFLEESEEEVFREARKNQLKLIYIKDIPVRVNMRKGHPLSEKEELDVEEMAKYPYVAYCRERLANLKTKRTNGKLVHYKYKIEVEESEMRLGIVRTTDAYSIGCKLPDSMMEEYGLVSYPIYEESSPRMYAIVREGEEKRPEICRFLELLQEKLADI